MKQERIHKISNAFRSLESDQTMKKWNDMKNGSLQNGVLRIKIDMQHHNIVCRDPILFRFSSVSNSVQPTYDYACPVVDSIEGVTHVFRSVEFSERDEQFRTILNI